MERERETARNGATVQANPAWSEWMDKREAARYCGVSIGVFRMLMEGRFLPPCIRDTRPYRWSRNDMDTWSEARRLGLFGDWRKLVRAHGEFVAWELMLRRVHKTTAEIRAAAAEVTR